MNTLNPKRARSLALFKAALPGTQPQIIKRSGLGKGTVCDLIQELHGHSVHIGKWIPHPVKGPHIAVWVAGGGPDAIDTLPRLTRKEVSARYEKKIKGTDRHLVRKAKWRNRHWVKKAAKTPNTWLAILGVRVASLNAEG